MTYQKPALVDEEEAVHQVVLLALTAQTNALQGPLDQPETQQYWMIREMEAYRRVPDRYQQILGIGLAIEALHLQQEQDLETTRVDEILSRSLLKLTGMARDAVDHVKGREPLDALGALCGLDGPPDASVLREHVRTQLQVAKSLQAGAGKGEGDEDDDLFAESILDARLAMMSRELCRDYAWLLGAGAIAPALEQLQQEHDISADMLVALAAASLMVPADRARMVGQALHAGLRGEMVQALYILVPQFDHMIRETLRTASAEMRQTSSIASVPIEDPRVNKLLGEGLTLAFQGVLCDGGGAGLWHVVLEGRVDEKICESPQALYAWWLILQLVMETGAIAHVNQSDAAIAVSVSAATAGKDGGHD